LNLLEPCPRNNFGGFLYAISDLHFGETDLAADPIDYVVTDQSDLPATSTRTVIIEAPSIAPSDDASSTVETSADATTTLPTTEPLIFEGLTYIPIQDASAGSHLSTEYLARLARADRIQGRLIAGMWFLEMQSLQQFLSARPNP
jgi:hypothetical protein